MSLKTDFLLTSAFACWERDVRVGGRSKNRQMNCLSFAFPSANMYTCTYLYFTDKGHQKNCIYSKLIIIHFPFNLFFLHVIILEYSFCKKFFFCRKNFWNRMARRKFHILLKTLWSADIRAKMQENRLSIKF